MPGFKDLSWPVGNSSPVKSQVQIGACLYLLQELPQGNANPRADCVKGFKWDPFQQKRGRLQEGSRNIGDMNQFDELAPFRDGKD